MPLQLSPDDRAELIAKGYDPDTFVPAQQGQQQTPNTQGQPPSALATLGEHAAANVAPGAAFALAAPAGAAVGAEAGSVLGPVGTGAGGIIGGLVSGGVASWAAYKAQHGILNKVAPEFTAKMDSALQQGADAHPFMAIAGDVAGNLPSMEASIPKLSQLPFRVALGGSIGAALPLAQGRMPGWQDVASGAANMAVFGKSKFEGAEPTVESGNKEQEGNNDLGNTSTTVQSPFTEKSEQGYAIDDSLVKKEFLRQNPKPTATADSANSPEYYKELTNWKRATNLSPDEMRQALHDKFMASQTPGVEPTQEPLKEAKEGEAGVVGKVNPEQVSTTGEAIGSPEERQTGAMDFQKAKEEVARQETEDRLPLKDGEKKPVEETDLEEGKNSNTPVSQNTLNITAHKFLPSSLGTTPEVRPAGVEGTEPSATEKQTTPLQDQRTDAEKIQDEMEGTGAKHSEGQIDPKDLQRFEELRQARAAMQTAGTHMTPEGLHPDYSKNWTEAEGIKNKYGGMPPASVKGESGGGTPYKTEATPVAVADHINSDKATTGEVKQTTSKDLGKLGRMTGSVLDNLRSVAHEGAKHLANAYQRALDYHQHLIGRYVTPTILSGKKMTNEERLSVNKATEQYRVDKVSNPQGLSERAQAFFNAGKAKLDQFADEHIANKMPITDKNGNNRAMIKRENYWPTMWSQQVENMFRKGSDTEGISKAKKEFLDYNTSVLGKTKEEALDRFNSLQQAMASNFNSAGISHQDWFNALRKPLGDPLPPTWREQDPVRNLARYFDRASMAMSHYAKVESDPKAMAALGVKKNAWGHDIPQYKEGAVASPYAHAAVAQYHSIPEDLTEQTEKGFSSLATALFIANPGLEIHKIGSNFSQAMLLADNPYQAVRALGHAVMNMRDGWGHALEGGLIKLPATRAVDMLNNSLTTQQRMSAVAKVVRDISTFGGLTTRCNAAFQQMYFEHLLPNKIIRANSGDKNAQMQLKHWDADYKIGKTYSPAEIQQLASTVASYAHGTGDIRQMPAWMKNDSEISGFFQLAHWSVAQTNNFMHNVWMPAKRGNFTPLITGMVGTALAGYAIKDLREKLQGKHGQIPSLSEIAASDKGLQGNAPLLMYNAIAGMQYAGFGGLFSQVVKGAFDVAYKNNPQGATFPLEEIASDTIHSVNEAMTAIANDPNVNYADLAAKVSQHLLGANIKLAQIALNTGINTGMVTGMPAEKKMLADKLGQLRRFDMVSGLPYNEVDQGSNPYMNIEQSKFRMTQDVGQAMAMLPGLISNIMTKYHDNPDVLMQKIKALKENQYDTFPSMETVPLSFYKYLGYLQKEEGPEAAQAQLQDYMKHKAINEAKGSVVP